MPPEWKSALRQFDSVVLFRSRGISWHWTAARYLRAANDISLFVAPTSYIVPALLGASVPCVPIVHDLIAFRREAHDRKAQAVERLTLRKALRGAAHVCTISRSTKLDLLARYRFLSPAAVTPIFAGPSFSGSEKAASDNRTILCIATLCPRKNQKRLIDAYAMLPDKLREQYRLVLVGGRGWNDDGIVRAARETTGVEWMEYLSNERCAELLHRAAIFAFPSLYEGFGMPVLDAMLRGIPVLTSDAGSLREVAGDAALKVDPASTISIASGLRQLLEDSALRSSLSVRGQVQAASFSWSNTVDLFFEALGSIPAS